MGDGPFAPLITAHPVVPRPLFSILKLWRPFETWHGKLACGAGGQVNHGQTSSFEDCMGSTQDPCSSAIGLHNRSFGHGSRGASELPTNFASEPLSSHELHRGSCHRAREQTKNNNGPGTWPPSNTPAIPQELVETSR